MAAKKDDFSIKHITPKLGGERGTRNSKGLTSSHDLVEEMEFLYVKLEKAINNPNAPRMVNHIPIVEITLGNYKSSTKNLPLGQDMSWSQVFAFDKSKGDFLSVTLKEGQTNTVIGKKNFKISADIPTRVLPDPPLANEYYSMKNTETGHHMNLVMSVWFGTQADEVYSQAWFSDAFEVTASCVINTRPKLYLAPRLCYVRVTVVSGHDLIARDRNRTPSVYVKAKLGQFVLKTKVATGSNPSWNQDLIFVASEPLDGTVEFSLIDQIDDQHEECIGTLKRKLSEMKALITPSSAPVNFYEIEPGKIEPAGDTRRFSSTLRMKLATDQAYHVFDECIQYSSDYRAFVKSLWPGLLGKLEIGILGATGLTLPRADDKKKGIDSYVVAKYGNKWVRTRTVVDNASPKWNEQYSFDVYERSTVLTLGIYDNRNIVNENRTNEVPIGKVRIPLSRIRWGRLHTSSFPIPLLSKSGLKKLGEIKMAIRCVSVVDQYAFYTAPFRWILPKAHYKSPLSVGQIEQLRVQAVEVNCMNLARTEPPLRKEVVMDMLKPKSQSFSMRRIKANYERVFRIGVMLLGPYIWFDATVISTPNFTPKLLALGVVLLVFAITEWILWVACRLSFHLICGVIGWQVYRRLCKPKNAPLILFDLKMSKLDSVFLDELAEEFDSFPSSELDVNVLRMRYDRLRRLGAKVMSFMGDLASQGERFFAILTCDDLVVSGAFYLGCFTLLVWLVFFPYPLRGLAFFLFVYRIEFKCFRISLPTGIWNFFRRLPTNEELML